MTKQIIKTLNDSSVFINLAFKINGSRNFILMLILNVLCFGRHLIISYLLYLHYEENKKYTLLKNSNFADKKEILINSFSKEIYYFFYHLCELEFNERWILNTEPTLKKLVLLIFNNTAKFGYWVNFEHCDYHYY